MKYHSDDEDLELSKEVMEKDEVAVMSYDINVLLTTYY